MAQKKQYEFWALVIKVSVVTAGFQLNLTIALPVLPSEHVNGILHRSMTALSCIDW